MEGMERKSGAHGGEGDDQRHQKTEFIVIKAIRQSQLHITTSSNMSSTTTIIPLVHSVARYSSGLSRDESPSSTGNKGGADQ